MVHVEGGSPQPAPALLGHAEQLPIVLCLFDQRRSAVNDWSLGTASKQHVLTSYDWLPHESLSVVLQVLLLHTEACAHFR